MISPLCRPAEDIAEFTAGQTYGGMFCDVFAECENFANKLALSLRREFYDGAIAAISFLAILRLSAAAVLHRSVGWTHWPQPLRLQVMRTELGRPSSSIRFST